MISEIHMVFNAFDIMYQTRNNQPMDLTILLVPDNFSVESNYLVHSRNGKVSML